jgi:hypothetical protein
MYEYAVTGYSKTMGLVSRPISQDSDVSCVTDLDVILTTGRMMRRHRTP